MTTKTVLAAEDIGRALTRISFELLEANRGSSGLVLLGIPSRGVPLAARLGQRLLEADPVAGRTLDDLVGQVDITMYRDDLRTNPTRALLPTRIPRGGLDDKTVVLIDDVLFSGRTVRAALDAVAAIGRPRSVRLAVLVDRGHRELPIRADHVGKNLPTSRHEAVRVQLTETDGEDRVVIAGGAR